MKPMVLAILLMLCMHAPSPGWEHPDGMPASAPDPKAHFSRLVLAISIYESGDCDTAYNRAEDAAGILQIRRGYLIDAETLSGELFTMDDRFDREKSIAMFKAHMDAKCPSYDIDTVCMIHNAGNISQKSYRITKYYREQVKLIYDSL